MDLTHFVPEVLRYLTPLGLDVMAFVLVDRLALPRSRTREDGLTAAPWLTALTELAGVCRAVCIGQRATGTALNPVDPAF